MIVVFVVGHFENVTFNTCIFINLLVLYCNTMISKNHGLISYVRRRP